MLKRLCVNAFMLSSIPIDIVEIIIVKSFDYKTFQKLQQILIKLNEPSRTARINDKLSVVTFKTDYIVYLMNNQYHREYDKPDFMNSTRHTWSLYDLDTRMNKPSCCMIDGYRNWRINDENYRNNDYPCIIDVKGSQYWFNKDRNPYSVSYDGFRNNLFYIFRYL